MKDIGELFKKAGAWILITLLAVIMAITFEYTQFHEALDMLRGRDRIGSFNGESISQPIYAQFYQRCDDQAQMYRTQFRDLLREQPQALRSFFNMDDCIERGLKDVLTLNSIGERLGLVYSANYLEKEAIEEARMQARSQESLLPEDRMTLSEIYRRSLQFFPMDARRIMRQAERSAQAIFGEPVFVSQPEIESALISREVRVDLEAVRFSNGQLLEQYKKEIVVTEEQIKQEYEAEQAKLPAEQKRPYADEKRFVENRLKNRLAQERVNKLRAELGKLRSGFTLADVAAITGAAPLRADRTAVSDLGQVRAAGGASFSLLVPGFLKDLAARPAGGVFGPYQDGEFTVYVAVNGVTPAAVERLKAEDIKKVREEIGRTITTEAYSFISREESLRGEFQLNARVEEPLPQGTELPGAP